MRRILNKPLFWISFTVIIFFALFIRLYKLGDVPVSLYWDEMAMYVDVKSVIQTGQDMFGRPWYQLIYPSYGDFKLPVYIWTAILSAKVFGLSEWSLRLPSVLAGIGTIIVVGLLARLEFSSLFVTDERKSSSKRFAFSASELLQLLTMSAVAFAPWSIMFSRTAFEGHLGQFLFAVSVWSILASRKNAKLLLLAPVFGALATYAYFSVRFVWVVVFLFSTLLVHFRVKKMSMSEWKKLFLLIGAPFLLYFLLLIPMLRSPLYKDANRFRLGTDSVLNKDYVLQSNIYREMGGNSRLDRVLFNSKFLMLEELFKNYGANTSPNFMFVTGDPNLRHGTGQHGLFLLIFLPFFFYGVVSVFQRKKLLGVFLIVWWLVALLPASVPLNVPHALRSLNALVPLSLFIGLGMTMSILHWREFVTQITRPKTQSKFFFIGGLTVLFVIIIFSVVQFLYFYFTVYPKLSAKDWQDGYKQVAQAIYAERLNNESILIVPFDDRFYLWLMGYGPYTAKDFHQWQSEKYQFFKFGSEAITYENVDDQTILNKHAPVLVAGKVDQVRTQLEKMKTKPSSTTEVHAANEQDTFLIAHFK